MSNDLQTQVIADLTRRKKISRTYLRNLSPTEKIAKLVDLQEKYYNLLVIREANGGLKIPDKWQKWYQARYENVRIY